MAVFNGNGNGVDWAGNPIGLVLRYYGVLVLLVRGFQSAGFVSCTVVMHNSVNTESKNRLAIQSVLVADCDH